MIHVKELSKTFKVHQKTPGLKGSIESLFRRKWLVKKALDQVSLEINAGEIVGLVGANGAGKTTLVKCLAGIIHPSSGEAKVLGHVPFKRENELRRQIALIMGQKAQLWWDLPAGDCFLLLREIYQVPKKKFQETLDFLAQTLDVKHLLNIQIRRLSLGERMKMELIAALLHQPKVVFLDEPTIGLDLTTQRAVRDFLLDYRKEHNPAMILTSHYMEDIERLCKRIVIIKDGKFVYDGSLDQIVRNFATHKIIKADLKKQENGKNINGSFPKELGEVIHQSDTVLKVKVLRNKVTEAASQVLSQYPIIDLVIEEQEIGTIIESIMRKERQHFHEI